MAPGLYARILLISLQHRSSTIASSSYLSSGDIDAGALLVSLYIHHDDDSRLPVPSWRILLHIRLHLSRACAYYSATSLKRCAFCA